MHKRSYLFFQKCSERGIDLQSVRTQRPKTWDLIPIQFLYIRLENFVVMPNHVHGTLIIDGNVEGVDVHNDGDGRGVGVVGRTTAVGWAATKTQ